MIEKRRPVPERILGYWERDRAVNVCSWKFRAARKSVRIAFFPCIFRAVSSRDSDPLSSLYHNMPTFTHTAPFDTHKPALLSSRSCLADSCRFLSFVFFFLFFTLSSCLLQVVSSHLFSPESYLPFLPVFSILSLCIP